MVHVDVMSHYPLLCLAGGFIGTPAGVTVSPPTFHVNNTILTRIVVLHTIIVLPPVLWGHV